MPGRNPADQLGYGYRVSAAETAPQTTDDWWVSAYAVCANPPGRYHIVTHLSDWSSASKQTSDVACPSGENVLGTGARIIPANIGGQYEHGIGLQVARVDALGVLTRSQAHEQPAGYVHDWRLEAFAVCAPPPFGYSVQTAASEARDSESYKQTRGSCPDLFVNGFPFDRWYDRRPISVGVAVSNVAPGNVTINQACPFSDDEAWADAAENTPTPVDWDYIVVRFICVV